MPITSCLCAGNSLSRLSFASPSAARRAALVAVSREAATGAAAPLTASHTARSATAVESGEARVAAAAVINCSIESVRDAKDKSMARERSRPTALRANLETGPSTSRSFFFGSFSPPAVDGGGELSPAPKTSRQRVRAAHTAGCASVAKTGVTRLLCTLSAKGCAVMTRNSGSQTSLKRRAPTCTV